MKTKPEPGARVRLTGKFLRNTGQQIGAEGLSTWTVQACDCELCALGTYIASDQQSEGAPRHFHIANLEGAP